MKTVFEIEPIIKSRKISINRLTNEILQTGTKANVKTVTRLIDNEVKRLPLDLAASICTVLQLQIDDWIKIIDSPIELQSVDITTASPYDPQRTKLQYHLDQRGWSQTDLVNQLAAYGLTDRGMIVHKIYHGNVSRLPVELIAPISVILGVTPGQWIDLDLPETPAASIADLIVCAGMTLEEVQRALSELEINTIKTRDLLTQTSIKLRPASMVQLLDDLEKASNEYAQMNHYIQQYTFGHTDVIPEELTQQLKNVFPISHS